MTTKVLSALALLTTGIFIGAVLSPRSARAQNYSGPASATEVDPPFMGSHTLSVTGKVVSISCIDHNNGQPDCFVVSQ